MTNHWFAMYRAAAAHYRGCGDPGCMCADLLEQSWISWCWEAAARQLCTRCGARADGQIYCDDCVVDYE